MIKAALIEVQSVSLVCPYCNVTVQASNHENLVRRDTAALMWQQWQAGDPFTCPACHKLFKLPASPFKDVRRAQESAQRRSQGARDGWQIRRAKESEATHREQ